MESKLRNSFTNYITTFPFSSAGLNNVRTPLIIAIMCGIPVQKKAKCKNPDIVLPA